MCSSRSAMIMFAQYVPGGTFGRAVEMAEDVTDLAKRCAAAARDSPDCLKPLVSTSMPPVWQTFPEVACNFRAPVCVFPERQEYIERRACFVDASLALLTLSFARLPSIKHLKIRGGKKGPLFPPPQISKHLFKSLTCIFVKDVQKVVLLLLV